MKDITHLIRPEILKKQPYASLRFDLHEKKVWLNANENPWSPDPVLELNRYPEFQPQKLIKKFSEIYEVKPEQVLVSRGSDDAIEILIKTVCRPGIDKILVCPPTFVMFEIIAEISGSETVKVPLNKEKNFSLDVSSILEAWDEAVKLIFLVSPNNPTGTLLSIDDMLLLCDKVAGQAIVVVDEAYIEFTEQSSMSRYLNQYPNLVILRTLSKAYGLAGARCGAALANTQLIINMQKVITPFPIPVPVLHMVLKYLDEEKMKEQVSLLLKERDKMLAVLSTFACVKSVWPSVTNFILIEATNADKILDACCNNGIQLRNRSHISGCKQCIRITVGTPSENEMLLEVLKNVES